MSGKTQRSECWEGSEDYEEVRFSSRLPKESDLNELWKKIEKKEKELQEVTAEV